MVPFRVLKREVEYEIREVEVIDFFLSSEFLFSRRNYALEDARSVLYFMSNTLLCCIFWSVVLCGWDDDAWKNWIWFQWIVSVIQRTGVLLIW
jgi:hypothetical protein